MALATKCPQCGAMFRVVADQLKLRGGLVRCGQCRTVFDAIGSLAYVEDSTLAPNSPGAEAASSSSVGRDGPRPTAEASLVRLEPTAQDEQVRVVTVTATGNGWAARWPRIQSALAAWVAG